MSLPPRTDHEFIPLPPPNDHLLACARCFRPRTAHEQPASAAGSDDRSGTEWCPRCGHKMLIEGDEPPACSYCEQPAPAALETGEEWQRRDNEVFIHREMTPEELVAARAKGFKTTDIRYTVARFYGDDAEQNAQRTIDAVNSYHSLIAERERLLHALRRMLDNFSPYSTEDTERWREEWEACEEARYVIDTIDQKGSGSE